MWPFRRPPKERAALTVGSTPPVGHTGDPWGSLDTAAMSPAVAENLAAVLSCTNIISGAISALPAYVTLADDTRAEQPNHPLQRLIDQGVNENEGWSDFLESLIASTLLRGNGLVEIETAANGKLSGLRTLPWTNVTVRITSDGQLLFDYIPTLPPNAGTRRVYTRADVLYLRDRADNGLVGVSRLTRAAGAMKIALAIQGDAATFMNWASRPSGLLTSDQKISDAMAERFKQDFEAAYSQGNKGKVALLSGGLKWEQLSSLSAEDTQLIGLRNFSVSDVARIFNVPPFLLADPIRQTFASARESSRHFAMTSLMPWIAKLQRAFLQSVLSPEFKLHIDLADLLRADPEARWQSWQRARAAGVLSPNDIRGEEGWPASNDPTADSIAPPVSGGQPASEGPGEVEPSTPPAPTPDNNDPADDTAAGKIARLAQHRAA